MRQRLILFLDRRPGLVALLAGTASATGFAPLGLWPVTIACFALLLYLLSRRSRLRGAFGTGWLFGLGHFTLGLNWIATAFTFQAAMPAWIGWMAVPLLSLYLALFPALAAAGAWWGRRFLARQNRHSREGGNPADEGAVTNGQEMDPRLRGDDEAGEQGDARAATAYSILVFVFAATWVLTEWLRSWLFTGFAWNPLSAIAPWAARPASYIGTYGMSGLWIVVAGMLVLAWNVDTQRLRLGWGLGIAAFTGLLWLFNVTSFGSTEVRADARPTDVSVTIIQPDIEQGDKWDFAARAENFRKLARLTAAENFGAPRLILWPEAAVPDYLEDGYPPDWYDVPPDYARARIAALLGPDDLLLTGAVKLEPNAARTDITGARNSVFAINAAGRLGARYDKAHLVPYGEYLPMRPILSAIGLSRLAPGSVDFLEGPGPRDETPLSEGPGRVCTKLCPPTSFSRPAPRVDPAPQTSPPRP